MCLFMSQILNVDRTVCFDEFLKEIENAFPSDQDIDSSVNRRLHEKIVILRNKSRSRRIGMSDTLFVIVVP